MSQHSLSLVLPNTRAAVNSEMPVSALEICHILSKQTCYATITDCYATVIQPIFSSWTFFSFQESWYDDRDVLYVKHSTLFPEIDSGMSGCSYHGREMNVGYWPESTECVLFWHLHYVLEPTQYFWIQCLLCLLGSDDNNLLTKQNSEWQQYGCRTNLVQTKIPELLNGLS